MKINSSYTNIKNNSINTASGAISPKRRQPSFKSQYEINGDTISSRQQIFTLGMLMNNFWLQDARNTFYDIRRKYVTGKFRIKVNDLKDQTVERILTNNNIEFKKLGKTIEIYPSTFLASA